MEWWGPGAGKAAVLMCGRKMKVAVGPSIFGSYRVSVHVHN